MCMALNAEDPGPTPVRPKQVRCTLAKLREDANRGRAVVCDVESRTVGYALLIPFWSNELGGEVCNIDELFVAPESRGRWPGDSPLWKPYGGGPIAVAYQADSARA